MHIDPEDDILQDFLVESREILDTLGEQLVELEQRGDDSELLNAVFRGFHTIKGGAGFLGLDPLVSVCHRTEDLFNLLRNGEREANTALMDQVLRALDVVNGQFDALDAGQEPQEAPVDLLAALESLIQDGSVANAPSPDTASPKDSAEIPEGVAGDDVEAAFDAMVSSLDASTGSADGDGQPAEGAPNDDISDDEFEALLDQLHGEGSHGGVPAAADDGQTASDPSAEKPEGGAGADAISEDEFEALLDQLHGKGAHGGVPAGSEREASTPVTKEVEAKATRAEPRPQPQVVTEASAQAAAKPTAPAPGNTAPAPRGETSVRVDTARLDDIMNLVGELVLVRNRITTLCGAPGQEAVNQAVADLELVTTDLQSAVMKTRMQPIKKVYGRFPRLVRDLARDLGKEIELEMRGEDTDLDKNLVEAIADPLIHLVRNSCDHGIETPDVRDAAGKPRAGKLLLSAEQEGDHILLVIADDGGGIDPHRLQDIAVDKGLLDRESASRLSDKESYDLIFLPGFSTKEQISDVSGRGVGMDVVKTRIAQLNGTIEIDSAPGVGTTLRVTVPLTLAILPTLMVALKGRNFAMPMAVVREIFSIDMRQTRIVDGRRVVVVRDRAMPLFFLDRWLNNLRGVDGAPAQTGEERQVVSVMLGNQAIGLVVDDVLGLEEVVIKPLGTLLHGLPGLAGSTTTGDGRIALIIDIPSLIKAYGEIL